MLLLDFADELLLSIAQYLQSKDDISAFVRVNRLLYSLLSPHLYLYDIQQLGSSALLWAATHGKEGIAQKSLQEGANPQATADNSFEPLILAAANGHVAVVKLFLAKIWR